MNIVTLIEVLVMGLNEAEEKKYIDSIQATMPGITGRKIFSIREQIKLI